MDCMGIYFAVTLAALAAAIGDAGNATRGDPRTAAWEKVERLRTGQTVRVRCAGQPVWTGRLTGVSANALTLNVNGTELRAERPGVMLVQVKSRVKSALAGLAIGAGAGLGFGFLAGAATGLKSGEAVTAAGLGAGLFAAAGAGIGSLFPGWKIVYSRERHIPDRNVAPCSNQTSSSLSF